MADDDCACFYSCYDGDYPAFHTVKWRGRAKAAQVLRVR